MFKQGDIVVLNDNSRYGIVEKITETGCTIRYVIKEPLDSDCLGISNNHFSWSYILPLQIDILKKQWSGVN